MRNIKKTVLLSKLRFIFSGICFFVLGCYPFCEKNYWFVGILSLIFIVFVLIRPDIPEITLGGGNTERA